jgi:preprotein translocase subunit SecD
MKCVLFVLCAMVFACTQSQNRVQVVLEFRVAETENAEGLETVVQQQSGNVFYLHPISNITRNDIKRAKVNTGNGRPLINVVFTSVGAEKFAKLTGDNIGKKIAIIIDGEILSAPMVRDTIKQGKAMITGDFDEKEAERIASGIVGVF